MKNLILGLVVVGLSAIICSRSNAADIEKEITVVTTAGKAVGISSETRWGKVVTYFGIPYAEPTKRFEQSKPLLVSNSEKTIRFTNSPPACMQAPPLPEFGHPLLPTRASEFSEDCLRINVFKPADVKADQRFPILVWVPGDGYEHSDMSLSDGSVLALKGNMIVVTVSYRLDVFGFASMGNTTLPGNAALSDIISALKFIAANAEVFNGDPESITLGGRFSGAMAISVLLTMDSFYRESDKQSPLAQRVILHDGVTTSPYTMESDPLPVFDKLAVSTQCNKGNGDHTLQCLQELDGEELLNKASTLAYSWRPAINGIDVHKNPLTAIELGEFSSEIKMMIGENTGSGSLCDLTQKYLKSSYVDKITKNTIDQEDFVALAKYSLQDFFRSDGEDETSFIPIVSHEFLYRPDSNKELASWRDAFLSFCGSLYLRTPGELFARYASRLNAPVYRYEFDYVISSSVSPKYLRGTSLGEELPLAFPTSKMGLSKTDQQVSDALIASLAGFVKNGDPSTADAKWTLFNEMQKNVARFTSEGITFSTSEKLDVDVSFWRDVFSPISRTLSRNNNRAQNCKLTAEVPQSTSTNYLGIIFILLGIAAAVVVIVYLIRNSKKPYIWKS